MGGKDKKIMVSDQSDMGGNSLKTLGGDNAKKLEGNSNLYGISNRLIFISFITLCASGFVWVFVLGIAPTLTSVTVFISVFLIIITGICTLGFSLYLRARQNHNAFLELTQPGSIYLEMKAEIATLKSKNKELRRSFRTEQLKANAANRSKTAFLAHLSHDIRTPLNHIIGFADMVGHQAFGPIGDPRYLTYVRDIKRSGEGLLTSVAGVLELAELESGKRELNHEEILVDDLLSALKTRFHGRAARCDVILEVDCFCASIVSGDRMGYERMLENLLDNAFKFTQPGGRIKLAAWVAEDGVVIEITDTGIGIEKSRLQKLLEPMSHGDAHLPKNQAGIGLGLVIARSIAELSGGELAIDSTPCIGTTVAVSLPLAISADNKQPKVA